MTEEKKSVSEELMDDLEPIHPTEFDESDDIEAAKTFAAVKAVDEIMIGLEGIPLEDLPIEKGSMKEKVLKGPEKDWRKGTIWEKDKEEK